MAYFERLREVVSGPLSAALIEQRTAAGWQPVAVEWRRELPGDQPAGEGASPDEIPYGLRISDDAKRLEIDPAEHHVLVQMMALVVQDFAFSSIASDLNEKGLRTREGRQWDQVSVFNMLPRLIEIGPRLFPTEEWAVQRRRFAPTY